MKSKIFNLKFFITLAVVAIILGVAITLIVLNTKKANTAVVWLNGEIYATLNLSKDNLVEINSENGYNKVEVKNGKVCVIAADCIGQDCVLMKWRNKVGERIVCLPHKLVIELKRT